MYLGALEYLINGSISQTAGIYSKTVLFKSCITGFQITLHVMVPTHDSSFTWVPSFYIKINCIKSRGFYANN